MVMVKGHVTACAHKAKASHQVVEGLRRQHQGHIVAAVQQGNCLQEKCGLGHLQGTDSHKGFAACGGSSIWCWWSLPNRCQDPGGSSP